MNDGRDSSERATSPDEARRRRLAARLDDHAAATSGLHPPPARERLRHVCAVTVAVAGVDGGGITVMGSVDDGRGGHRDQLAATGTLARRLEDLQFTVGEGPCLDAFHHGTPVLAADLAGERDRWLAFAPAALAFGAAAVFSLPLQVGAIRMGTLDLHRGTAGGLSPEQLADTLAMSSLATETLLDLADHGAPAATDRPVDATAGSSVGWLPDVHADVHVASGMVAAQNGTDVASALLRVRAHAYARGEPIHEVARRIVDRDLVLGRSDDDPHDTGPDGGPAPHEEGQP